MADEHLPPTGVRDPLVVDALKRLWSQRTVERVEGEGLRERKKRILRQQISDQATLMFLQRGFDEVRVSEIADACGVSEKTVFNYFPTKESLLFDREDQLADELADAFSDRTTDRSLAQIALAILTDDVEEMFNAWSASDEPNTAMIVIRQFAELVERTPALQAAMHGMMERLTTVTAEALAERADVDPDDPEPQMAAAILMGLWRVQFLAMQKVADGTRGFTEARDAILDELRRAARVADSGLSSFNLVVQHASTKQQLQDAAEAANEARKQVVAAMQQARVAWMHLAQEARAHHDAEDQREQLKREQRAARRELRETIRSHQTQQREQQAAIRQRQIDLQAARRQRRGPG